MTAGATPRSRGGARRRAGPWAAGAGLLLLAACSSPPPAPPETVTTVVLLPEASGQPAEVVVTEGSRSVVLSQPYAQARRDAGGLQAGMTTPEAVRERFGPTIAALPARPSRSTLYFVEGRDTLTDESRQQVERTLNEVAARPVPDVVVVGHTDAVGSHAVNDALSLQRAGVIRAELIRLGVAPQNIQVIGRGKREPAVPTADGVSEPRNRRVEIVVR